MGEVIRLAGCRRARSERPTAGGARAEFFFDLCCPFCYLAAERVDRGFGRVAWRPASALALGRGGLADDSVAAEALRRTAERRAAELRMPLQWPDRFPADVPAAMRAAAYAAEQGRGGGFVLAAARLAFCGGFDLDDPEILAEAAAAAGIALDACLQAAGDAGRDGVIEASGRRLLAIGADRLPALVVSRALVCGERPVAGAAVAAQLGGLAFAT